MAETNDPRLDPIARHDVRAVQALLAATPGGAQDNRAIAREALAAYLNAAPPSRPAAESILRAVLKAGAPVTQDPRIHTLPHPEEHRDVLVYRREMDSPNSTPLSHSEALRQYNKALEKCTKEYMRLQEEYAPILHQAAAYESADACRIILEERPETAHTFYGPSNALHWAMHHALKDTSHPIHGCCDTIAILAPACGPNTPRRAKDHFWTPLAILCHQAGARKHFYPNTYGLQLTEQEALLIALAKAGADLAPALKAYLPAMIEKNRSDHIRSWLIAGIRPDTLAAMVQALPEGRNPPTPQQIDEFLNQWAQHSSCVPHQPPLKGASPIERLLTLDDEGRPALTHLAYIIALKGQFAPALGEEPVYEGTASPGSVRDRSHPAFGLAGHERGKTKEQLAPSLAAILNDGAIKPEAAQHDIRTILNLFPPALLAGQPLASILRDIAIDRPDNAAFVRYVQGQSAGIAPGHLPN